MGNKAFFFENGGLRLFAVLHRATGSGPKRAVVFCHPYGEEKQLSYRVFVRFGSELCRRGFDVLRFDCGGYGDSEGAFEAATLDTQIADTKEAVDVLHARTGVERVDLLGLRLGGTIAALVAPQVATIGRVVLWNPIISGKHYLDELITQKIVSDGLSETSSLSRDRIVEQLESKGTVDLGGQLLTHSLYARLLPFDLTAQIVNYEGSVLILTVPCGPYERQRLEALAETYRKPGCVCELKVVEESAFWDYASLWNWSFPLTFYRETARWMVEDSGARPHPPTPNGPSRSV